MSVGSLKRILLIVNVLALLGLSGTAYGFWSHRQALQAEHSWPDFTIAATRGTGAADVGKIKNINLTLGKFPEPKKPVEATETEEPTEEILSVLKRLGDIIGAVVFYPPYGDATGFRPSISFKLTGGTQDIRTIAVGEALETRPHPELGKAFQIPHRYQFVRCERDPEDPTATYFVFDMKLDGTDIQKVKWQGDIEVKPLDSVDGPDGAGEESVSGDDFVIVSEREIKKLAADRAAARKAAADKRAAARAIRPVEPDPNEVKQPVVLESGVPGTMGSEENGTWVASDEGSRYIKDNWEKVVEEARTSTYRNPKTGKPEGVLVRRLRPGSVANKLGIRADDVIKSINDRRVLKKSQAIAIVRDEIDNKKRNILVVRILRNGKEITKRFDARDPETRRAAKDTFRKYR